MTKKPPSNRLRVLRAEVRITQREAAKKAKIGPYRYWMIENGHTEPTPDELASFAKLFRVAPESIFPGVAA